MEAQETKRLGLLVPSSNTVVEQDFQRALPAEVTLHVARARLETCNAEHERVMLDDYVPLAAKDLGTARVELLHFSCTSAAAILGGEGEKRLMASLSEWAGTPKVTSTMDCVTEVLEGHEGASVGLVTPYVDELTSAVALTLTERGVNVTATAGMGILDNFALAEVQPQEIVQFTYKSLVDKSIDVVFVSCTNFRGVEAKDEIEQALQVPVVTSNSASTEVALRRVLEAPNPGGN